VTCIFQTVSVRVDTIILTLPVICATSTSMPQVYACVLTCGKEFKKSSSLVQHKQSCTAVLEIRKKSQQIRKDKGDDAFPKETSGRKQRLQVSFVSLYYVEMRCIHYLHRLQSGTHTLRNAHYLYHLLNQQWTLILPHLF
jgi:hypothetical protein